MALSVAFNDQIHIFNNNRKVYKHAKTVKSLAIVIGRVVIGVNYITLDR
jgi:hypothetical protein